MQDDAGPLAPGFLVAMPQLVDPNFRRSVVLLTAHAAEGAMGFIINRALPATVSEVLEGLSIAWKGRDEEPVWLGGPVTPQSGWVLFADAPGIEMDEADEILPGVYLSASREALRRLADRPPRGFRLLLGHAQWGPGQLEAELVEGSWLLLPADQTLLLETPAEEIWTGAFRGLGVEPTSIVPGGGVQ